VLSHGETCSLMSMIYLMMIEETPCYRTGNLLSDVSDVHDVCGVCGVHGVYDVPASR
jgi:hypothetical protein